ncbi:MAG: C25 family cysteine peptidase [Bacteroidales bacterium]
MKRMKIYLSTVIAVIIVFGFSANLNAESIKYRDSWGESGFNLTESRSNGVSVVFSVEEFQLDQMEISGENMHVLNLPDVFLPNQEGAPNLPGTGRYIAMPQGATPVLEIVSMRKETFQNINMAPAPVIPLETENELVYEKDENIYSANAFYPAQPVKISENAKIRGVDVVILGITPFQYNPVTRELIVYRDIEVNISFEGGNGQFGEERLRSRWWDPILMDNILNYQSLPEIDYNQRLLNGNRDEDEGEYIIVCPNGDDYQQWADSIRDFRTKEGILTKVATLSEIGGNSTYAIENYLNNAYNDWSIPPAAVLFMGDYGTNASVNVIAPIYDNYCASDNIYADVDGDHMPDIVAARMTANNFDQLETMITKFLNYERTPPTNSDYYENPITALGWQTERWFQICAESGGGFWNNELGKSTVRINEIYSGTPGSTWSTAQNTSTVVGVFGPDGLGYIPATPSQLGGWSGGSATMINNSIESGAFMMLHRDHGSTTGWGEPSYNTSNIGQLENEDLIHVFSINCLTGKYNMSGECFAEKFHRHTKNGQNSGALSITAASETSYSFVNDTYVWGMFDNMWPNFMPQYGTTPGSRDVKPAFGNAAGKYFLEQSSWPYNTSNKEVTYHLFHHHGDAFSCVHYNMPQQLSLQHDSVFTPGATSITISSSPGALIGVTLDGELIGTGTAGFGQTTIQLSTTLQLNDEVVITGTKQNYIRSESLVPVRNILIAGLSADTTNTCEAGSIDFFDETIGDPTSWTWTFEGGDPDASTEQNPQDITYAAPGSYDVTLEVSDGIDTETLIMEDYIQVFEIVEPAILIEASQQEICEGTEVMFTADCVNEGSSPVMDWFVNGDPAGDNNDTIYLDDLANNDIVTCELTSSEPCAQTNPVMSNEILMTVNDYVDVSVSVETSTTEACEGEEVTFTAIPVNEGEIPVYTWMINGEPVGDDGDTYSTTTLEDQDEVVCELLSSEMCTNMNPVASDPIVMTIMPTSEVSVAIEASSNDICEGDEVTFTATPVNPGEEPSYQWKVNGIEEGGDSPVFTTTDLLDEDEVTCALYSDVDCPDVYPATSNAVTMMVEMLPEQPEIPAGPQQVDSYVTQTTEYTVTEDPNATAYHWTVEPAEAYTGMDALENTLNVTWDQSYVGTAAINVYGSNNCGDGPASDNLEVAVENAQGIDDMLNNIGISVFPNPNKGTFQVQLNSATPVTVNIRVLSTLGEEIVSQENISVSGEFKKQIDMSHFSEGIYFLMIENNGNRIQKPIIIQK